MNTLFSVDEVLNTYGEGALDPAWLEGLTLENEDEKLIVPMLRTKMTLKEWLNLPSEVRDFIMQVFAESLINT